MPQRLNKSKSEPFFMALQVSTTADGGLPIRSAWQTVLAIRGRTKGKVIDEVTGKQLDYDTELRFALNDDVLRINELTVFFLDNHPSEAMQNGDYRIVRIGKIANGLLPIYFNKIDGLSYPFIYYKHGDVVAAFQCNYDNQNLIAYVGKNVYVPFDETTIMWSRKPQKNTKLNLMRLEKTEFVHYGLFKKLTFTTEINQLFVTADGNAFKTADGNNIFVRG